MRKILFLGMLASGMMLLTSCLGDSESRGQIAGYFTIASTTNQTILYMDGGGTVYPTSESVNSITQGKGWQGIKRAFFYLTYPQSGLSYGTDGLAIVKNAELQSGESIPVLEPLSEESARAKNLLDADSINEISALQSIWGFNGYITTVCDTKFYTRNNKGVAPTVNLMVDKSTVGTPDLKITLLLNRHKQSDSDVLSSMTGSITTSYDLASVEPFYHGGFDTITVHIEGLGLPNGRFVKIPVKELKHR